MEPRIILFSPMTRSLQSAQLLSAALNVPCTVEFDLHEWVPDMSFSWTTIGEVMANFADLETCGGEWPPGETRAWDPLSAVRKRVLAVFARHADYGRILVVCHGEVVRSLAGVKELGFAELVPYPYPASPSPSGAPDLSYQRSPQEPR